MAHFCTKSGERIAAPCRHDDDHTAHEAVSDAPPPAPTNDPETPPASTDPEPTKGKGRK